MTGRGRAAILAALVLLASGGYAAVERGLLWALVTPASEARVLSAPEAHVMARSGEIVLVDIRRPDEWAATGIPRGAVPLDMRRDDFTEALREIAGGTDMPVALICARGVRSAALSNRLAEAGFGRVADVAEGMFGSAAGPGWIARDLPRTRP